MRSGCGRDGFFRRLARRLRVTQRSEPMYVPWADDDPPDSFVREPRRPGPTAPSTAAALELPDLPD